MEVELVLVIIAPNSSLPICASHSYKLRFCWIRGPGSQWDYLSTKERGKVRDPLSLHPHLPPSHTGLFMPVDQQSKEGVPVLLGEIFLNYYEMLELLIHT